ncbi:MAG TPA: FAD-dependent monooxygenase [Bacteroidia bacterium]|jgi:flavin-dependent dehydrogenase|nr:FAD-dependent monooxygenase [Bacteroidia bacterium]
MESTYDVIILGGGLAGLTLSIQLKRARPDISILILEKREHEAAVAAHKVGESTVELGSHYFREVLGLKNYLEKSELPKHGLRFFFPSENKADIASRVELGPRDKPPTPSHQLDRGTFENELIRHTRSLGTDVRMGARVKDVDINKSGHTVTYVKGGEETKVSCRWIADASSRVSILKRKLGFAKDMDHAVNSVWYRLKGVIDIGQWSENETWKAYLQPGLRLLSTVHFMDKGYWVWVIPLGSKNTSIGIVADPAVHPFEDYNTYEKALKWLEKNEPLCYQMLEPLGRGDGLMDFKILRHYAHHSERVYSEDRWGVTGEAGAFLDPLYSPGSDFIAMNNTWLSDLILRDLAGEDISIRASIYEKTHLTLVDNWIPVYQNKYPLMGKAQTMTLKIFWDWTGYWAVPTVLFANNAFTDMKLLKELFSSPQSLGRKFGELNKKMQDLFIAFGEMDNEIFSHLYLDPFDLTYMYELQKAIRTPLSPDKLIEQISSNMQLLEKVAAEIFRRISSQVNGTPDDMKVNPYLMSLDRNEKGQPSYQGCSNGIGSDTSLAKEVGKMWFYKQAVPQA